MWMATISTSVPYPGDGQEPVEIKLIVGQSAVRGPGSLRGVAMDALITRAVIGNLLFVMMEAWFPDNVNPSDINLEESTIRFTNRALETRLHNATDISVAWAVVAGGVPFWCYPAWISEVESPEFVAWHLVGSETPGFASAFAGSHSGSVGVRPYSATKMIGYRLGPDRLSSRVGLKEHSDMGAETWLPDLDERVLVRSGGRSVTSVVSPVAPPEVVAGPETASLLELSSIESRLITLQRGVNDLHESLSMIASYAQIQEMVHRLGSDNRTLNANVIAVGDEMRKNSVEPVSPARRLTESLVVGLAVGSIMK